MNKPKLENENIFKNRPTLTNSGFILGIAKKTNK